MRSRVIRLRHIRSYLQVGAQGLVEIQKHDRDAAELVSKLPESGFS